ncbi:MAG: DUF3810 domain-containing protein [Clostridiales bacterium]|nr:DUF3810 domain-containing protein [Clostridiales bacterium]
MTKWKKLREICPLPCIILFSLAVVAAGLHVSFYCSSVFADFFNMSVGAFCRGTLAKLTGVLPFSLAETVVVSMPVLAGLLIFYCVRTIRKESSKKGTRLIFILLSVLCLLYSLFVFVFASAYRGASLDQKLGYEQKTVSKEDLYETALYFNQCAKEQLAEVTFAFGGASDLPYSHQEMIQKLNDAYAKISDQYSFVSKLNSPVKLIALSEPMTYTHISGVYTFYTGEANLNINFPDYTLPYTAAHEMSHQRGIAAENEANFMAFLVCEASEDAYIRYSGFINMYEYLMNALYTADKTLYNEIWQQTDSRIQYELKAYSDFYSQYSKSTASVVTNAVNDAYLKTQGQSAGTKSYGMVVDLAVSYVKNGNHNSPTA